MKKQLTRAIPQMTDQERILASYHPSDIAWAKQAVADTLHGLHLNQMLVNRGFWDKYIVNMRDEQDLDAYAAFAIGLQDLYKIAKRVEKSRQKSRR